MGQLLTALSRQYLWEIRSEQQPLLQLALMMPVDRDCWIPIRRHSSVASLHAEGMSPELALTARLHLAQNPAQRAARSCFQRLWSREAR